MTRFMQEITGQLGEYWRKSAEKELDKIRGELDAGTITIDHNGVGRNRIGRALSGDMLEKVAYVTDAIDVEATEAERDREVDKFVAEYRRNAKPATEEQLMEMRAAFGPGATVVDVITGQEYVL